MIATNTDTQLPGQPIAEYRISSLGAVLISVLLGCPSLVVLWFQWHQGALDQNTLIFCGMWTLFFLVLLLPLSLYIGGQQYQLLEHGLLHQRRRRSTLYRWEEVVSFERSYATSGVTMMAFNLRLRDGTRLGLSGEPNRSRFAKNRPTTPPQMSLYQLSLAIQQASYPHRLAAAQARFDAGGRLTFGQLALSQTGLSVKRAELPWVRIADLQACEDTLVILEAGQARPWQVLKMAPRVPNKDLVLGLIEHSQGPRFSISQDTPAPLATALVQSRSRFERLVSRGALVVGLALMIGLPFGRYWLSPRRHIDQGETYLEAHQDAVALAEFDAALAQEPSSVDALLGRGQVSHRRGELDRALADYDAALRVQPNNRFGLVLRGQVYSDQGRYQQALDAYGQALAASPGYAFAYCSRGDTYQRLSQPTQALGDFTACRDRASTSARREEAQRKIDRLSGR